MNTSKAAAIQLKLKKAKNILAETDVLMKNQFYSNVINRLQYSCFHATKALLLTKDLIPKTHKGVIAMLHENFVRPGLFDPQHASFFSELMQKRIKEDYDDEILINETDVIDFIEPAKRYITYIVKLIMQAGFN